MSGQLRLLDLVKPFLSILPEVEVPIKKVPFEEKISWTVATAVAFSVMSEIPLYGIASSELPDPIYWLRPVVGSSRGSLLELGTIPLLTSGFLFQLLAGAQVLDVNFDYKSDRELFQSAQKLFAIVLTVAQSVALVFSGLYGAPSELGVSVVVALLLQLVGSGIFVILVNEILDKGYSFGPGSTFFATLATCQQFFWNGFSLSSQDFGRGKEYTGSVIALFHYLWNRRSWKKALVEAFFRSNLPNLTQLYITVVSFGLVAYLLSFRIEIPVKSTKMRGTVTNFPIRLLYTGAMPILVLTAFIANISIFSNALYKQFPTNLLVRIFGTWDSSAESAQAYAVSGLAYYLQPPFGIVDALWDPLRTGFFVTFVVVTSAIFAKTWSEISGSSPKDVAKLFKSQGIVIVGHRDVSVAKELSRIIPLAASVGGALAGLIAAVSNILGSVGGGVAVIVAVTTIQSYYEILAQEGGANAMGQVLRA